MKKKTLQKVFAAVLAGAMVAGTLTACGNSGASTSTDTSGSTDAGTDTGSVGADTSASAELSGEDAAAAGMDGWTAFDSNVTLKIPVYDRGGSVDVTKNYWTDWVQENFGDKYNITVEYVAIPRGDVLNAYANLGNAKDLPTILMEYDFDKMAQWADDGYLQELDLAKFQTVAPNYWAQMVSEGSDSYTDLNGTTYFALARRPYWNVGYTFVTFYRADWLEEIGKDYPRTFEEQKEVYKALKEGGYCEYPIGGKKVTGSGVDQNYGFRSYPQDELEWATTGGYAIPPLSTDATKKLIQRQNELYNLGYIDPDFTQREATDDEADFIAGKMFTYGAYIQPSIEVLDNFYSTNPDAKLAIAVTPGLVEDSEGVTNASRVDNPFGMMIGFSALASEEEITAAMMYMEWMLDDENLFTMQYGIEGETFDYVDGYPTITNNSEGTYAMANNNKDYWCVAIEAKVLDDIKDTIKLTYPVGYPDSDDFYDQIVANYEGMVKLSESGHLQPDCNFAVALSSVTDNQANLLALYEEYRSKLTICKPDEFDALYEEYSKKYLDAGYQAIIDERTEAYNNGMSSHLAY